MTVIDERPIVEFAVAGIDCHHAAVLDEAFCALAGELAPGDIADAVLACPPLEAELVRRLQRRANGRRRWQRIRRRG